MQLVKVRQQWLGLSKSNESKTPQLRSLPCAMPTTSALESSISTGPPRYSRIFLVSIGRENFTSQRVFAPEISSESWNTGASVLSTWVSRGWLWWESLIRNICRTLLRLVSNSSSSVSCQQDNSCSPALFSGPAGSYP